MTVRSRPWRLSLLGAAGCAALVSACGATSHAAAPASPAGTASTTVGALQLRGGYIPAESSPDEAAAYFSLTNTGKHADSLLSASSPDAAMVMLHQTENTSNDTDVMVPLNQLSIPAGKTEALQVGGRHLMLMSPTHELMQGQTVPVTLMFAHAGTVTVQLPVVAATGPTS